MPREYCEICSHRIPLHLRGTVFSVVLFSLYFSLVPPYSCIRQPSMPPDIHLVLQVCVISPCCLNLYVYIAEARQCLQQKHQSHMVPSAGPCVTDPSRGHNITTTGKLLLVRPPQETILPQFIGPHINPKP